MINKLKNWWVVILATLLAIMDLGFDAINPFLNDLGVSPKAIIWIKVVFGIYVLIKAKLELPTQNSDKLNDLVQRIGTPNVPKKN